jgi:hypothetical protein
MRKDDWARAASRGFNPRDKIWLLVYKDGHEQDNELTLCGTLKVEVKPTKERFQEYQAMCRNSGRHSAIPVRHDVRGK